MKKKFYALKDETNKIILTDWEEAKKILPTLNKPIYKSFSSKEEAEKFLNGEELAEVYLEPTVFIDGSYDGKTESYSFGGVLLLDGNIYQFKKAYEKDEFSTMRNVAGEIKGAGYVIQYAINHSIKKLHIYYDYIGIENWYTKQWKASSLIATEYVKFCDSIRDKIEVIFHKVKSHTNNYYNDLADKLAKEALGI